MTDIRKVKVQLSLWFDGMWMWRGEGGVAAIARYGWVVSASCPGHFTLGENAYGTPWIGWAPKPVLSFWRR